MSFKSILDHIAGRVTKAFTPSLPTTTRPKPLESKRSETRRSGVIRAVGFSNNVWGITDHEPHRDRPAQPNRNHPENRVRGQGY